MAELYRRADESDGTARNSGKAVRSNAAPASAPGVATPFAFRQPRRWRWLPRHPTRATSAALLRLGRATRADSRGVRPVSYTHLRARPRSLTGPRRLRVPQPHVAAAAPAVGSWQRCLRSPRSGTAAIQPQLPDSARGRAPPCTPRCAGGKLPAAAAAVVSPTAAAAAIGHIMLVLYAIGARLSLTLV